jgi:hypothetical protein
MIQLNGFVITKESLMWKVTRPGSEYAIAWFADQVEAIEYAERGGLEFLEDVFFGGGKENG